MGPTKALLLAAACLALTACAAPLKVETRPCGALTDSLSDVTGKTRTDQARIDAHYEAGRSVNCWR